jgi:hypothetical protein
MRVIAALITLILLEVVADSGDVAVARAQATEPPDSLVIVENYLLARNLSDFSGAASWCAPLLELQDVDDSWFVDRSATVDWLRQLTSQYHIDTVAEPHQGRNAVTWTERLTRRGEPSALAGPARMTIDVHAVIRDGKIAYLSGQYPPIPLRNSFAAPGEPAYVVHSNVASGVSPGVLFLGSALGLALLVTLIGTVGRLLACSCRLMAMIAAFLTHLGVRQRDQICRRARCSAR